MKRKLFANLALIALVLPLVLASPVPTSLTKEHPSVAASSPVSVAAQEAQPPAGKESLIGQAVEQGGEIVTAGNAFYRVHVQKSAGRGVGLFTVTTGSDHPSGPGLNLLHGDGTPGTSFTTVRSYNTGTDYIQGMGYKNSGYSCIYLDKFGKVTPLGTIGFRATYTLPGWPITPDALTIIQDVTVQGTTHHDSKVVVTTKVSNRGTDIVQVGIRYLWDFQSVSDDGPTFQQIVLPLPEKRVVETEYRAPAFKQFAMTDNDGEPKPQDFTVVGSAKGSTASAQPDVLKYACWPHVFDTAFDYDLWHCDIATKAAAHQTGARGGDSAVTYYFGGDAGSALTIPPDGKQAVSATLFAFSPTKVKACPVCTVQITGGSKVNHYCAAYVPSDATSCGTFPAPNIKLTAKGMPAGGTFAWSIAQGADKIDLVGGVTGMTVMVKGKKKSAAKNDVKVKVKYTAPNGAVCESTHSMTVLEPSSITSTLVNTPVVGPPFWGYTTVITYTVKDKFGNAMGAGICIDETITVCGAPPGVRFRFADDSTDAAGQVVDELLAVTMDPAGLSAGFCVKQDQDITAGGCGPLLQNILLFKKAGVTKSNGNCAAGSGCP